MSATLTVTSKGQVTLRKELLRHLGVRPGEKVEIDLLPDGRAELHAAKKTGSIEDFIGCAYRPGTKPRTIEQINEAIAKGWAGEL
ncbi:MAG TPA: AbrB/MazE/SpoVT family DNA-binding domain-containing protein [Stellaceae bacterium]|jgi:bifunctional DNA-binding transcriptional regulator/antitoxin component of YhaV-PrlF toxin-antitoxin module|nr:AbrB/MazE/SpoVT family DNA-binding domain-containing protein [Stellaceae bacterium]